MQGCRDAGMQGCRDAGMQGCRDAGMQGCRDAGMQVDNHPLRERENDMKKTAREMVNDVQSKICDLQLDMLGQGYQLDRLRRELDTAESKLMIEEAKDGIREERWVVAFRGGPENGKRRAMGFGEFNRFVFKVLYRADWRRDRAPSTQYGAYTPSSGDSKLVWIFRGWYESEDALYQGYNDRRAG
jgi:hypothetical protein